MDVGLTEMAIETLVAAHLPRTVYLPLLKVGAPRAALAARPQLPDQPEQ